VSIALRDHVSREEAGAITIDLPPLIGQPGDQLFIHEGQQRHARIERRIDFKGAASGVTERLSFSQGDTEGVVAGS